MIRSIVALGIVLVAFASPATAQTTLFAPPTPSTTIEFLPRYSFHLNAEHLSSDDPRYVWDTNFGGELDFVDFVHGRATFYANYEAVLGEEFHVFDPNQGNYILGGLITGRIAGVEVGGGFHHESRHLSDRPKRQPVDWNMLAAHAAVRADHGAAAIDGQLDFRHVILQSYVDYDWQIDGAARLQYSVAPHVAWFGGGGLSVIGTDGSRARGTQTGGRGEGGVRLEGHGAAVELFVAAERRIDPYPLEFGTTSWISVGFRMVSR